MGTGYICSCSNNAPEFIAKYQIPSYAKPSALYKRACKLFQYQFRSGPIKLKASYIFYAIKMSECGFDEEDQYKLELLEMKLMPASPSESAGAPHNLDFTQCEVPPDYPNNWRGGEHYNKDDRPLFSEQGREQTTEGFTLQKNFQKGLNMNSEEPDEDFSGGTPPFHPSFCCGYKLPICVLGILISMTLLSSLGALTLSISNYANEKYRFHQLEIRILQIQAAAMKDKELPVTSYAEVNATVGMLSSQISQLQSSVESQTSYLTSQMMDLEEALHSANETHQQQIDFLNTSSDTLSSQVSQLQSITESQTSTSNNLVSEVTGIKKELYLANQTETITQQQIDALNTSSDTLSLQMSQLRSIVESQTSHLTSQMTSIRAELHSAYQTHQWQIDSLNASSDTLSSQVSQLQSAVRSQTSTSDNLASEIASIKAELNLVNQTQTRTQHQVDSLNTSLSSQVSQLQSIMLDQSNNLVSRIISIEAKLHFVNQTHQQQIDSLNTSYISAVNFLTSSLQSIEEDVISRLILINEALNSTRNATDMLLISFLGTQEAKFIATASKLSLLEEQANATRDSVQMQLTTLQAEHTRDIISIAAQLSNTTIGLNHLLDNVSYIQTVLQFTNYQLNSTRQTIASLSHGQASTRQTLDTVKSCLNTVEARFNNISSAFHSLSASLTSPLELYRGCYRDKVNCTVYQHQSTRYWYRCTTASVRINTQVSVYREGGRLSLHWTNAINFHGYSVADPEFGKGGFMRMWGTVAITPPFEAHAHRCNESGCCCFNSL